MQKLYTLEEEYVVSEEKLQSSENVYVDVNARDELLVQTKSHWRHWSFSSTAFVDRQLQFNDGIRYVESQVKHAVLLQVLQCDPYSDVHNVQVEDITVLVSGQQHCFVIELTEYPFEQLVHPAALHSLHQVLKASAHDKQTICWFNIVPRQQESMQAHSFVADLQTACESPQSKQVEELHDLQEDTYATEHSLQIPTEVAGST